MKKDIKFLKELQIELREQETDGQADPCFWVIGDYRYVAVADGDEEAYELGMPDLSYYGLLDDFLEEVKDNLSEEDKEALLEDDISALEWLQENYDEDAYLVPVQEQHFVHSNTMFLTKKEAQDYIEANKHNLSNKAHTYAMTAMGAPTVKRLLALLKTFDWNSVERSR